MCFGEMRMEQISDLIRELTITSKTPNGISVYKKDDKKSIKTLYELFSELSDICDGMEDSNLYNLVLLFSAIGEGYRGE